MTFQKKGRKLTWLKIIKQWAYNGLDNGINFKVSLISSERNFIPIMSDDNAEKK